MRRYITEIVHATREPDDMALGGSPRLDGVVPPARRWRPMRDATSFGPTTSNGCPAVIEHRLILKAESRLRKLTPAAVVADLVADQRVPMLSSGEEEGLGTRG